MFAIQQSQPVEEIELQLLLEGVFLHYGFDFRNYALSSLRRRVWNFMRNENITSISLLQDRILHQREWLERFLYALSVNVSAMFRDPHFYRTFRKDVVPSKNISVYSDLARRRLHGRRGLLPCDPVAGRRHL